MGEGWKGVKNEVKPTRSYTDFDGKLWKCVKYWVQIKMRTLFCDICYLVNFPPFPFRTQNGCYIEIKCQHSNIHDKFMKHTHKRIDNIYIYIYICRTYEEMTRQKRYTLCVIYDQLHGQFHSKHSSTHVNDFFGRKSSSVIVDEERNCVDVSIKSLPSVCECVCLCGAFRMYRTPNRIESNRISLVQ